MNSAQNNNNSNTNGHGAPHMTLTEEEEEDAMKLGLELTDFVSVVQSVGIIGSDTQSAVELFRTVDFNGDGSVTWEELSTFLIDVTMTGMCPRPHEVIKTYGCTSVANKEETLMWGGFVGDNIVTVDRSGKMSFLDHALRTTGTIAIPELRGVQVFNVEYIPDGDLYVIVGDDMHLRLIAQEFNTGNTEEDVTRSWHRLSSTSYMARWHRTVGSLFVATRDGCLEEFKPQSAAASFFSGDTASGELPPLLGGITGEPHFDTNRVVAALDPDDDVRNTTRFGTRKKLVVSQYTGTGFSVDGNHLGVPRSPFAIEPHKIHDDVVRDFIFIGHQQKVITCSMDKTVKMYDIPTRTSTMVGRHIGGVTHVANSEFYRYIVSVGKDGHVNAWMSDVSRLQPTRLRDPSTPHTGELIGVYCVGASPQIITGDEFGLVKIWDARTFRCVQSMRLGQMADTADSSATSEPQHRMTGFFYNDDTNELLGYNRKTLFVHGYDQGNDPTLAHNDRIVAMCYNAAIASILTCTVREVRLWDTTHGCVQSVFPHLFKESSGEDISAIATESGGRRFYVGNSRGYVQGHSMRSATRTFRHQLHNGDVTRIHYIATTRLVVSAGTDGAVVIFNEATDVVHRVAMHERATVTSLALSQTIGCIVSGCDRGNVQYTWPDPKKKQEEACRCPTSHLAKTQQQRDLRKASVADDQGVSALITLDVLPAFVAAYENGSIAVVGMKPMSPHNKLLALWQNTLPQESMMGASALDAKSSSLGITSRSTNSLVPSGLDEEEFAFTVLCLAFSRETHLLWGGDDKGCVVAWSMCKFLQATELAPSRGPTDVQFPAHTFEAPMTDFELHACWRAHDMEVTFIEILEAVSKLVTSGDDMRVRIWDQEGNALSELSQGRTYDVRDLTPQPHQFEWDTGAENTSSNRRKTVADYLFSEPGTTSQYDVQQGASPRTVRFNEPESLPSQTTEDDHSSVSRRVRFQPDGESRLARVAMLSQKVAQASKRFSIAPSGGFGRNSASLLGSDKGVDSPLVSSTVGGGRRKSTFFRESVTNLVSGIQRKGLSHVSRFQSIGGTSANASFFSGYGSTLDAAVLSGAVAYCTHGAEEKSVSHDECDESDADVGGTKFRRVAFATSDDTAATTSQDQPAGSHGPRKSISTFLWSTIPRRRFTSTFGMSVRINDVIKGLRGDDDSEREECDDDDYDEDNDDSTSSDDYEGTTDDNEEANTSRLSAQPTYSRQNPSPPDSQQPTPRGARKVRWSTALDGSTQRSSRSRSRNSSTRSSRSERSTLWKQYSSAIDPQKGKARLRRDELKGTVPRNIPADVTRLVIGPSARCSQQQVSSTRKTSQTLPALTPSTAQSSPSRIVSIHAPVPPPATAPARVGSMSSNLRSAIASKKSSISESVDADDSAKKRASKLRFKDDAIRERGDLLDTRDWIGKVRDTQAASPKKKRLLRQVGELPSGPTRVELFPAPKDTPATPPKPSAVMEDAVTTSRVGTTTWRPPELGVGLPHMREQTPSEPRLRRGIVHRTTTSPQRSGKDSRAKEKQRPNSGETEPLELDASRSVLLPRPPRASRVITSHVELEPVETVSSCVTQQLVMPDDVSRGFGGVGLHEPMFHGFLCKGRACPPPKKLKPRPKAPKVAKSDVLRKEYTKFRKQQKRRYETLRSVPDAPMTARGSPEKSAALQMQRASIDSEGGKAQRWTRIYGGLAGLRHTAYDRTAARAMAKLVRDDDDEDLLLGDDEVDLVEEEEDESVYSGSGRRLTASEGQSPSHFLGNKLSMMDSILYTGDL
eukprot:PhM_4_TR7175/c0_g2_i1/m.27743